jgi:hypothetical protein
VDDAVPPPASERPRAHPMSCSDARLIIGARHSHDRQLHPSCAEALLQRILGATPSARRRWARTPASARIREPTWSGVHALRLGTTRLRPPPLSPATSKPAPERRGAPPGGGLSSKPAPERRGAPPGGGLSSKPAPEGNDDHARHRGRDRRRGRSSAPRRTSSSLSSGSARAIAEHARRRAELGIRARAIGSTPGGGERRSGGYLQRRRTGALGADLAFGRRLFNRH